MTRRNILRLIGIATVVTNEQLHLMSQSEKSALRQMVQLRAFYPSTCKDRFLNDLSFAATALARLEIGIRVSGHYARNWFPAILESDHLSSELLKAMSDVNRFSDSSKHLNIVYVDKIKPNRKGAKIRGRALENDNHLFISIESGNNGTLLHEILHLLGLGHTDIVTNAACCANSELSRIDPISTELVSKGRVLMISKEQEQLIRKSKFLVTMK